MNTPNNLEWLDELMDFDVWCMCGADECVLYQNYKEARAKIATKLAEAYNEYPYEKIARHATYDVPITDLDADPSGETVTYETCYLLPKKWVDAQLTNDKEQE